MLTIGRELRPHHAGYGEQLLVDDVDLLEDAERDEIPAPTLRLFETWRELEVPDELEWSRELRQRHPVLERASFDDRVYWTVRLARFPRVDLLAQPCFGADGIALGAGDLASPLGWLAAILYEADGDVVFADPASDDAYWVGSEWTGDAVTRLPIGWRAITHFVLWRLLDGGWMRPSDLAMLAAVRR